MGRENWAWGERLALVVDVATELPQLERCVPFDPSLSGAIPRSPSTTSHDTPHHMSATYRFCQESAGYTALHGKKLADESPRRKVQGDRSKPVVTVGSFIKAMVSFNVRIVDTLL